MKAFKILTQHYIKFYIHPTTLKHMGEWNKHILKDAILQKSLPPKDTFSGCYWMTCSSSKQMDNEKGQCKFYSTASNTGKIHQLYRKLRKLPATVELKNLAAWRNISKGGKYNG